MLDANETYNSEENVKCTVDDSGLLILNSPLYTGAAGNLYSYEQMVSMFMLGFKSAQKKSDQSCKKNKVTPYYIMRNMNVGEFVTFTRDKHNAARSAASLLKKQYKCSFSVHKKVDPIEGVQIQVRRDG